MKKRWFFENLKEEALKYKTKGDFRKNSKAAYSAANKRDDYNLICSHMPICVDQSGENNPFYKWNFESLHKEALKFKTRKDFEKGSPQAYQASYKRDDYGRIVSHMAPSMTSGYSDKELISIALKYFSKKSFKKNDYGAYQALIKRGIYFWNNHCAHIVSAKRPPYSDEEIYVEAFKYNSRKKFSQESPTVYNSARKKGKNFLNQVCSHMKRPSMSSPEKAILEEILKHFPTAKKFRATKLKIPGKEYIKTLEVDILVPELGKAIEYDGGWYHSLEGLKRGHPTWPERDIVNYHQIKDSVFLNLGISILHIKQDEWKKNKENCLSKCLDFLNS